MEIYLYNVDGVGCSREAPPITNMPGFANSFVIRNSNSISTLQITELQIGDVIISKFEDSLGKNHIICGIVCFSSLGKSRIDNINVSDIINDLLDLYATKDITVKIFVKNDFMVLKDGLTIGNNVDYINDIIYRLESNKQYKIQLH